MRIIGSVFIVVGGFFLFILIPDIGLDHRLWKNSVVTEGKVVAISDNRDSVSHWKYHLVELEVEYSYSSDSLARTSRACISHGTSMQPDFDCAEVGASKKVRFIPPENKHNLEEFEWAHPSDSGKYSFRTSFSGLAISTASILIGCFMFWIGRSVKHGS